MYRTIISMKALRNLFILLIYFDRNNCLKNLIPKMKIAHKSRFLLFVIKVLLIIINNSFFPPLSLSLSLFLFLYMHAVTLNSMNNICKIHTIRIIKHKTL